MAAMPPSKRRAAGQDDSAADHDPFRTLASEAPSPERAAHSAEFGATLAPALAAVSEIERTAFVLRHYGRLPIDETASAPGIQQGAARHSIFRAVRRRRWWSGSAPWTTTKTPWTTWLSC
jgi:DNA-directed RNA polymerase specialized sigma24 family protein